MRLKRGPEYEHRLSLHISHHPSPKACALYISYKEVRAPTHIAVPVKELKEMEEFIESYYDRWEEFREV